MKSSGQAPQAPSSELDDLPLAHAQPWERQGHRAPAAMLATAPASLHTDGDRTGPSAAVSICCCCCCPHQGRCLERCTRNNWLHKARLFIYAVKESFNPELPGTAQHLNSSPFFCSKKEQHLKGNKMDLKKVLRQKKASGTYWRLETARLVNICMAESFCSWSASDLYVCFNTGQ